MSCRPICHLLCGRHHLAWHQEVPAMAAISPQLSHSWGHRQLTAPPQGPILRPVQRDQAVQAKGTRPCCPKAGQFPALLTSHSTAQGFKAQLDLGQRQCSSQAMAQMPMAWGGTVVCRQALVSMLTLVSQASCKARSSVTAVVAMQAGTCRKAELAYKASSAVLLPGFGVWPCQQQIYAHAMVFSMSLHTLADILL